jgi:DNA replication protein DnaC
MDNVREVVRQSILARNPNATMGRILNDAGIKIEINNTTAVFHVRPQNVDALRYLQNYRGYFLEAAVMAFPNVTDMDVDNSDTAFSEELQQEKAIADARATRWQAEEEMNIRRQKIERHNKLIDGSNLPPITQMTHTFEKFHVIDGNREGFKAAREYIGDAVTDSPNTYDYSNRQPFLTLHGKCGTGKTHLAFAIGWVMIAMERSVCYYQVERFLDTLRSSFNKSNTQDGWHEDRDYVATQSFEKLMKNAETVDLLILDDLGAEKDSDWAGAKLDALIDFRYENQRDTVFTTNLDIKELSPRIASRVGEGNVVKLETPDFRKVKAIQRANKQRKA